MRTLLLVSALVVGCTSDPCAGAADVNCDGTVNALDGPLCEDCEVRCLPAGNWDCYRDGATVETWGFACSTSTELEERQGLRLTCGTGAPVCTRESGAALDTDLEIARCILPVE